MAHEFGDIAYPPYMVAFTAGLFIAPIELFLGDLFANLDGFQHGTVADASAADVIDLTMSRRFEKLIKSPDQIPAVDIVPDLLALVSENDVGLRQGRALHQISQKTVELRARVARPRQAAAAETDRRHAEITAVLLHEKVRRRLGCAE